jgi:cell division protein FtsB
MKFNKPNIKLLKKFKNMYLLIFIGFAIWMLFIDANSFFIHNDLNNEIEDLNSEKEYYNKEIKKDNKGIKELSSDEGLEKFAREKYYMKKENEEIYIIEYQDSIAKLDSNEQ